MASSPFAITPRAVPFSRRGAQRCTTPGGVPALRFGAVPASSPLWRQQQQQQQQQQPAHPQPHRLSWQQQPSPTVPPAANTPTVPPAANTPGTRPSSDPLRAATVPSGQRVAPLEAHDSGDASNQVACPAPPAALERAATAAAAAGSAIGASAASLSVGKGVLLPSDQPPPAEAQALQQRLRTLEEALATADRRADDLAAENALFRASQAGADEPRRSSTGELDARLAAASSALWDGARRVAELAAERRELAERCARAEAAARAARDSCERLAAKLASALGPANGLTLRHAQAVTPQAASQQRVQRGEAARDALLALGRKTFEQRSAARKENESDDVGT